MMNENDKDSELQNQINSKDKSQPHSESKIEDSNDNSSEIRLHVIINQATDLLKLRWLKKPDPYVTIHLMSEPKVIKQTHFKSATINPVWDEEFDLITKDLNDILLINMYHYMNDKKIIDEFQYPINTLTIGGPPNKNEVEITFNNKSAGKIFFEVQAFRIPKSDIIPFCTFAATGKKFINQKYYRCITCGFTDKNSLGICENCVKCCHKGHEVQLAFEDDSSLQCFCDCPSKCKCCCMPEKCDLPCTSIEAQMKPINQPMYYCSDCDDSCEILICQNCAMKFHHGHQLIYLGIVESEICQNNEINRFE